jgi:taurine dioxygenase
MLEINRFGEHVGAEILGADVRQLDDNTFAQIYQTWLQCNVIAVRDQSLTVEEFLSYSRRFGQVNPHPSKSTRHPDHPEITLLGTDKFHADGTLNQTVYARGGSGWHTDGAYDDIPFKATQLYACAIPDTGGDTLFASMYAAHDSLPGDLKALLEGRYATFTYGGRSQNNALLNPEDRDVAPARHPLLRVHGETGRTALYFDPGKILAIEGLSHAASEDTIEALAEHMIQPHAQYRHRWRVGDIVIWDNRCSYHKAAADYPPEQDRIHWRVSIKEPAN